MSLPISQACKSFAVPTQEEQLASRNPKCFQPKSYLARHDSADVEEPSSVSLHEMLLMQTLPSPALNAFPPITSVRKSQSLLQVESCESRGDWHHSAAATHSDWVFHLQSSCLHKTGSSFAERSQEEAGIDLSSGCLYFSFLSICYCCLCCPACLYRDLMLCLWSICAANPLSPNSDKVW